MQVDLLGEEVVVRMVVPEELLRLQSLSLFRSVAGGFGFPVVVAVGPRRQGHILTGVCFLGGFQRHVEMVPAVLANHVQHLQLSDALAEEADRSDFGIQRHLDLQHETRLMPQKGSGMAVVTQHQLKSLLVFAHIVFQDESYGVFVLLLALLKVGGAPLKNV